MFPVRSVGFDDPNLVSAAGLVPAMRLAERCGLHQLSVDTLTLSGTGAANPAAKVGCLVAGMVAGADSIDDMDLLRHGGMSRLFDQVRAPSTLGTFLRSFTFGHVRQLDKVAAGLLISLTAHTPLLRGVEQVCFVDIDDTIKKTYGYAKQGAGYGYSGVKGINALIGTISTPLSAPVVAATRLRKGSSNSARGAARLVADTLKTAGSIGAGTGAGLVVLRADSAYYTADVVAAAHRGGARVSITARMGPSVARAIGSIPDDAWIPIHYPNAVWDDDEQRLISDAEVAEVGFVAFTSRPRHQQAHGRLIVRRVKRLNPIEGQDELFTAWRYHAVFTDTSLSMLQAETTHRQHAVIEQVIADLKDGALAHLPSGKFTANAAWLVCAAMAFNLTRATGTLASTFHAKATTATIRRHLITVAARIARSARRTVLHLPRDWPWATAWTQLFDTCSGPPPLASN